MKNKKEEPTLITINARLEVMGDEITEIKRVMVTGDKFSELVTVVLKDREDMALVKEAVIGTQSQVTMVLNQIDAFRKSVEFFDQKVLFHKLRHDEAQEKITDHEKRITALEQAS